MLQTLPRYVYKVLFPGCYPVCCSDGHHFRFTFYAIKISA